MIISYDTVIIYGGKLKKNTPFQVIPLDEVKVKAILSKEKAHVGEHLTILLKVSSGAIHDFFMREIEILRNWITESGITDIQLADMDGMDQAVFKLIPVSWARIDSLRRPSDLKLNMPKEGPEIETILPSKNVLTVVLLEDEEWFAYFDNDISSGKSYATKDFKSFLGQKKRELGDELIVLIKPTEGSDYAAAVDILDLMTITKIKQYAMYKLSAEEEKYFNIHNRDLFDAPPEPIVVESPKSAKSTSTDRDGSFFVEITAGGTIYWWINDPGEVRKNAIIHKVRKGVIKREVLAYRSKKPSGKIMIKGDKDAKYPDFEYVIQELKEANEFKYQLVTEK
ncbi:MAG TPA: hypothetical protein VGO58_10575 [Chitinophagaceae bacterium]|nr:hypothetical protein [Chitinophagaceae bacterium]